MAVFEFIEFRLAPSGRGRTPLAGFQTLLGLAQPLPGVPHGHPSEDT
jgi:hypothetical protein